MKTTTTTPLTYHIRWGIRRDMPEVLAIELHCFWGDHWDEEDFMRCLRQRNHVLLVAEHDEKVVGFMAYELCKSRLQLLNFAVHEDWRFQGVGRQMVEKLKSKLSHVHRSRIMLEIRDSNLGAQLFFQRMGFRCVSVLREFYSDTADDAYLFQYRHGQA